MLQSKHCLFLSLLITVIIVCVLIVKYVDFIQDDISDYDSLENDVLYKYRIHLENSNNRPIRLMSQRKNLLDDICKKYEDPFRLKIKQSFFKHKTNKYASRVEHRGLYRTYPPVNHFSYLNVKGKEIKLGRGSKNISTI